MVHADREALARLAAGELPEAERGALEAHLGDCQACADVLAQLEMTRSLLREGLIVPPPAVDWQRVDGVVQEAVTRDLARQHRRPLWPLALVAAGAAVVLAVALAPHRPAATPPPAVAEAAGTPAEPQGSSDARVERAEHTQVVREDATTVELARGDALRDGVRLRTERAGQAVLQLPDNSRAHLGAAAEVQVVRADSDDVALSLAQGRLTVQASHVARRGFVVQSEGVRVHVVGTAFSVLAEGGRVEVAVLEGRVRVETGRGPPQLVGAGERLLAQGRTSRVGLAAADREAFRALGLSVREPEARAPLATAAPSRSMVVQAPPQPLAPAPEATARPPSALQEEEQEADDMTAVAAAGPRPFAPDVPSMLVPVPPAAADAQPAGADVEGPLPRTAEERFLLRAGESLQAGNCEAFLLGLEELTEQPGTPSMRAQARFLRARCFEERVMPAEAEREYLRYLRDFPAGPHAAAARAALSARE